MNETELAWVSGVFEGEGCIHLAERQIILSVQMTDEDVVRRLHSITGLGHITTRENGDYKPSWDWRVTKHDDSARLLEAMLPLLGQRRTRKAREAIDWLRENPPRRLWTECKRGHPLSGENLLVQTDRNGYKHRYCLTCRRRGDRRRRRRSRAGGRA